MARRRAVWTIVGFLVLAFLSGAAMRSRAMDGPAQKPIRVQAGWTLGPVAAPKVLAAHGVASVTIRMDNPPQFSVTMTDSQGALVGTFSSTEDIATGRAEYRLQRPDGSQVVLSVALTRSEGMITSEAHTSDGGQEIVQVYLAPKPLDTRHIPATGLRAYDGVKWTDFPVALLKQAARSRSRGPLRELEDKVLFRTGDAKLLRDAMFATPLIGKTPKSGVTAFDEYCPECEIDDSNSCSAMCIRTTTLLPIYVCDDGYWKGCYCSYSSGFWMIEECGFLPVCYEDCCAFTMCAAGH